MARKNDVNINIKTKTDARALDKVRRKMADLNKSIKGSSKEATKQMSEEEKAAKKAADALKLLNKQKNQAEKEAYQHARALEKEEKAAQRAAKANSNVAKETTKAGKSSSKAGNSILYASQAFEDLQYGIRGVLNNIPQLIMSLGGTAGLAGVISIVAVVASKLGGAFNMTKTSAEGLGDALDKLDSDKLDDFKTAMSDASSADAFAKAIDGQTAAIKRNTSAVDKNITKTREARSLRLDIAKSEANLELAQIAAGSGSASEKAQKSGAVKARLAALSGADQAATLGETLTSLRSGQAQTLSDAEAARIRANELNQGATSSGKSRARGKSAQRAESARARNIETLTGFRGSDLSALRFGDDRGGREIGGDPRRTDERITKGVLSMGKAVDELQDALKSQIPVAIERALKDIVGVAESNAAQLRLDQASAPELRMQTEDRNLNKVAQAAKNALENTRKIERFKQEEIALERKREKDAAEALEQAEKYQRLKAEAERMDAMIATTQAKMTVLAQKQANNTKAQRIRDELQVAELKKAEAAAKAKAQAAAIRDAERDLIRGGKSISSEAAGMSVVKSAGNDLLAVVSRVFKDGIVSATESPDLKNAISELNKSNAAKDNALLIALQKMISENNKMADQVRALKANAKRQEK